MRHLCRVCLTKTPDVLPLESPINEDHSTGGTPLTILKTLETVMSQKLLLHEKLPQMICAECKNLLTSAYDLKTVFQNSQTTLQEKFESVLPNDHVEAAAPVELIFSGRKFDLNDVLIVEEKNEDDEEDFQGFLQNLGTAVSAVFVNKREEHESDKVDGGFSETEFSQTDLNSCAAQDDFARDARNSGFNTTKGKDGNKRRYQTRECLCDICGYTTSDVRKLKYHLGTHLERAHQCHICDKKFSFKYSLNLHVKGHSDARPHLCTMCGKDFFYSNALVYHMRMHRNERNFVCEVCDRRFYMPCALKRHMRIHTNDRPYICTFCSKGFRSSSEKKKHEMIHRGERPHKCRFCERTFVTRYNQGVHHMAHPGPHACDYCERTFMEVEFLRKHIRCKHGAAEIEKNKVV